MTTIHLTKISALTPADWATWLEIQEQQRLYESPYFRPEFTQAVAGVRDDVEVAVFKDQGSTVGFLPFQRGKLNLGKPVGGKLSDYHGPLLRAGADFDPRELLQVCRLATWDFDHLIKLPVLAGYVTVREQSPRIDLTDGFDGHIELRRQTGSDTNQRQARKIRKMAREVGELHLEYNADDDEAYHLLKQWKSAQYVRTGLTDVFAFHWTNALLAKLRTHQSTAFSAPLTVLRAGNKVAAIALSLRSYGVLHGWFTAYSQELYQYSPGITLFLRLAEESPAFGIHTIDLGRGKEAYKWSLASGSVEVGEGSIASPSVVTWLRGRWRRARDWVQTSPFKDAAKVPAKLIQPLRSWLAYH